MFQRAFFASMSAVLLALLLSSPSQATQQKQDQSDDRDGPSRNEAGRLSYIPLMTGDGEVRINQIVVIQTEFIHVVDTSGTSDGFGVDFKNLDKIDVSDVPFLGSILGREYSADDFTEENRIGSVYEAGDGTLATVLKKAELELEFKVIVVNGKGAFQILMQPKIVDVAPAELKEFGALPSVRAALTDVTLREGATVVLGGLTQEEVPEAANKVPWLGDIPMLQQLFRGTAHRGEKNELMLFITPSILTDSES